MTRPFFSLKGRAHSFVYAGCGVITLLKTQHNTDKAKRDDAFKYVPLTLSELWITAAAEKTSGQAAMAVKRVAQWAITPRPPLRLRAVCSAVFSIVADSDSGWGTSPRQRLRLPFSG